MKEENNGSDARGNTVGPDRSFSLRGQINAIGSVAGRSARLLLYEGRRGFFFAGCVVHCCRNEGCDEHGAKMMNKLPKN